MTMRLASFGAAAAVLLLAGCGSQDPREQRIDNIEDAADAVADNIEDVAERQVDAMQAEAGNLANQAKALTGFEAERLQTRAGALKEEAKILDRQADARARAVKDKARAEVSAIRAE